MEQHSRQGWESEDGLEDQLGLWGGLAFKGSEQVKTMSERQPHLPANPPMENRAG